jgi:hypothetical protein
VEVRLLQGLTGSLSRALGRRAQLETAVREAIVEVAFVWAHFQLVSKPADALDEQIVFFGRAGTLEGIQGMLRGKRRLRELERWEILFAGVVHAQAYCDRYADHEIREAISSVKTRLCPPPREWPSSRIGTVWQDEPPIATSPFTSQAD